MRLRYVEGGGAGRGGGGCIPPSPLPAGAAIETIPLHDDVMKKERMDTYPARSLARLPWHQKKREMNPDRRVHGGGGRLDLVAAITDDDDDADSFRLAGDHEREGEVCFSLPSFTLWSSGREGRSSGSACLSFPLSKTD